MKISRISFFIGMILLPALFRAQVVINEYSCANVASSADNFGEFEDWLELYNPTASPVNIGGFHLSDKVSNPTKWQIPSGTVPANGYLRIWASGRGGIFTGNIHAGFKLTQCKPEILIFADGSGTIIDSVTLDPNQIDHSRGRTTDGALTWSVFTTPTPGAPNLNAQSGYATTPVFSQPAGFYTGPVTLSLSSPDPNVTIYYTLDGSVPSMASTLYSASPINISATTVVRAAAFSSSPGVLPSFVETNTYFINETHTVNVVSLASANYSNLFGNSMPRIKSSIEYFDINKVLQFEGEGSVNPHGNDSWAFPQKGIDFIMKDDYGYNYTCDHEIFTAKNRDEFDRIMFKAGASDNYPFASTGKGCHLRDAFIQTVSQKNKFKLDERSYEPCVLYINGQYWGVYEVREKVNDPDFTNYYYDQDEPFIDVLSYWGGLNVQYGSDTGWVSLYNFIMSNSMAVQANYDYVDARFNLESLIDYVVYNTYIVNSDWLNWNSMWWRGRDPNGDKKKWRYALWDEDNTFDLGENYTGWPTTDYTADPCAPQVLFPNAGPDNGHMDMFNKLMLNPGFEAMYINRYADLMNTALSCDSMIAHLDRMINVLTPEMPRQISRWGGSMSGWQNNLNYLKSQITGRCSAIDGGIVDCYSVTGPFDLTFDVFPAGAGEIKVNTIWLDAYPWTGQYFGGILFFMKARAFPGYVFDYWDMPLHTLSPDINSDSVTTTLSANDYVTAYFRQPGDPPGGNGDLFVPNAFSPNGDGNNDVLYVLGGKIAEMEFVIYDRWGEKVFETKSRGTGWDGKYKGSELPSGVYAWRIHVKTFDDEIIDQGGNITLIR